MRLLMRPGSRWARHALAGSFVLSVGDLQRW
jgi:hypothetical protein